VVVFSLNTFIKLCLLDTGGRISEIQKRISGAGGYEFYKPLQTAVRSHCSEKDSIKIDEILNAPNNDIERKYNKAAFDSFHAKFGTSKSIEAVKFSKRVSFPKAGISINVDPLFELSKSGVREIYSVWPTQQPELTQRYGAVACYLLRQAYSSSAFANGSFFYTDIVSRKTYSEKQISNNTNLILTADVNTIGTLLNELQ